MTTSSTFLTARFGEISFTSDDILLMPDGMIGFPNETEFVMIIHKEGSPFRWMQSLRSPELAFLVVDPAAYIANYAPEVREEQVQDIELTEDSPRLVYTVVNIPKGRPQDMTLNLAGPIVINALTRRAKQLVIEDPRYGLRHRVMPKSESDQAA